jgi:Fe2+ transport system protein FeoA
VTVTGFVEGDEDAVRKIIALGIIPGDVLGVLATWPTVVFELGSTSYALDSELAGRILVTAEV